MVIQSPLAIQLGIHKMKRYDRISTTLITCREMEQASTKQPPTPPSAPVHDVYIHGSSDVEDMNLADMPTDTMDW
jgi:hypothetical protein